MSGVDRMPDEGAEGADEDLARITTEEERVLARIQKHLANRRLRADNPGLNYDEELLALRDQINEARLEDIPPLIEEMERLTEVAARRAKVTEGAVDPLSPYFGRLVLEENDRRREVLIGRSTYLDGKTGVRIVDWRDAPVSRLYYRYEEGDEYEEVFGGREVLGEVAVRRALTITAGALRRIGAPQGSFARRRDGSWRRLDEGSRKLEGGQGAAMRAESHHAPGKLGVGGDGREETFLPEITALIDPRQFELISASDSGLVVIQGGAGSGKTTIGLHRLAYLNYQDKQRFRPDRMMVLVFNRALERYISKVLPALGVEGVPVTTYERWAEKVRRHHVRHLPDGYDEDTPSLVTRLKKHPAMLRVIDRYAASLGAKVEAMLERSLEGLDGSERALALFRRHAGRPVGQRLEVLARWAAPPSEEERQQGAAAPALPLPLRHAIDRVIGRGRELAHDAVTAWAEILTDLPALEAAFAELEPERRMSAEELREAHAHCVQRVDSILREREERIVTARDRREDGRGREHGKRGEPRNQPRETERERSVGIDGEDEAEPARIDREDDTLLLRLVQRLWGPLKAKRDPLAYEHILVDEAQDLSPVELAVVVDTAAKAQSVTLAGDVAQRLMMDNGFSSWAEVLRDLGLEHVEIEPLKITYRSSAQIIDFSLSVLGPLADPSAARAIRDGAPVEHFETAHSGEAVAFLGEALRDLMMSEPRASVAVIARYPEQADIYYEGLKAAEVPYLRRIADQDFPFKSGVDVTDVRQVKGLEFDYVVLIEVSAAAYPADDEARHLLHIAATRAAHQLWVVSTGTPSPLLPEQLTS